MNVFNLNGGLLRNIGRVETDADCFDAWLFVVAGRESVEADADCFDAWRVDEMSDVFDVHSLDAVEDDADSYEWSCLINNCTPGWVGNSRLVTWAAEKSSSVNMSGKKFKQIYLIKW